jgi:hypothetical protein
MVRGIGGITPASSFAGRTAPDVPHLACRLDLGRVRSRPHRRRLSGGRDHYHRGRRLVLSGIDLVRHPPRNDIVHAVSVSPRSRSSARMLGTADCGFGDLRCPIGSKAQRSPDAAASEASSRRIGAPCVAPITARLMPRAGGGEPHGISMAFAFPRLGNTGEIDQQRGLHQPPNSTSARATGHRQGVSHRFPQQRDRRRDHTGEHTAGVERRRALYRRILPSRHQNRRGRCLPRGY